MDSGAKKFQTIRITGLTVFVAALALAGCGNDQGGGSDLSEVPHQSDTFPTPTPTPAPSATPTPMPTEALDTPQGVGATAVAFNEVHVSWDAVVEAERYEVFRQHEGADIYKGIASTTDATFVDRKVAAYTSYSYKVVAIRGDERSAFSTSVEATTPRLEIQAFPAVNLALLNCVLQQADLVYADLIMFLSCQNASVDNLEGVQHLIGLRQLRLSHNIIVDLLPLLSLSNLYLLALDWNAITDVNALASLKNLETLDLNKNLIEDITPLTNLTNLLQLAVGWNQFGDISPLSNLTGLFGLTLDSNVIEDVAPLATLTRLTGLSLRDNQVASGVAALDTLTYAGSINFLGNNAIPCADLDTLIAALGSDVVCRPAQCAL